MGRAPSARTAGSAKSPRARKRSFLAIRVRDELKSVLESVATAHQRSLSEEAERRLEDSLTVQESACRNLDLAFGPELAAILLVLAKAMQTTGENAAFAITHSVPTTSDWLANPFAFDQVARSVTAVMESLRPEGAIEPPRPMRGGFPGSELHYANMGPGFAVSLLGAIAGAISTTSLDEWAKPIRARLGSEIVERLAHQTSPPGLPSSQKKIR
jgi:hypothetical protein